MSVKGGSTVFVLKIKGKPANINLSHECLKELETFSGLVVCILRKEARTALKKMLLIVENIECVKELKIHFQFQISLPSI